MRRLALLFVLGAVIFGVLPVSATGGGRAPPTVFWLGPSFEGLPLVAKPRFPPSFIYERCRPSSHATCEVQVQNWLLRYNHPASYDKSFGCVRLVVRGVPAALFESSGGLDVYTGRRTIRIFGGTRGQMIRAAKALRSRSRRGPPRGDLPRPAIRVGRALRRCRAASTPLTGKAGS